MHGFQESVCIRDVKHRTTIELDQALLDEAREVLGTTGIRETVERAMREAIDAELRRQLRNASGAARGSTPAPRSSRPNPLER